jgi:hypothetical protein
VRTIRSIVLVAALLAFPACTHFTPYHRADLAGTVEAAAPATIDQRVILIGDSGAPSRLGEPVLDLLARRIRLLPDRTTVVFLGDIVYERGMPEPLSEGEKPLDELADVADAVLPDLLASRGEAERQVRQQLAVMGGTTARALFVAGNHDWDQFEIGGWDRILALESFIRDEARAMGASIALTPSGGCPGPVAVRLGRRVTVIALDTQWWIDTRKDGKPVVGHNPTRCPWVTEETVRAQLLAELTRAAREGRYAIVAAHHPLETEGPHGGFVDFRTHLFPLRIIRHYVPFYVEWIPLPVLGSAIVWLRQCCSPSGQDMSNKRNRHMRRMLEQAFKEAANAHAEPLVYAAGHDHNLQVFEGRNGPRYSLVSGMGSRASAVGGNRRTLFAHTAPFHMGFMEIEFLTDGRVRLGVWESDRGAPNGVEVFSMPLLSRPPERAGATRTRATAGAP